MVQEAFIKGLPGFADLSRRRGVLYVDLPDRHQLRQNYLASPAVASSRSDPRSRDDDDAESLTATMVYDVATRTPNTPANGYGQRSTGRWRHCRKICGWR